MINWYTVDGEAWAKLQERLDKEIRDAYEQSSLTFGERIVGDPSYFLWKSFVGQLMFLQKTSDLHCYILSGLIDLFWLLDPNNSHETNEVRVQAYALVREMLISLYMPEPSHELSDERIDRMIQRLGDIQDRVDALMSGATSPKAGIYGQKGHKTSTMQSLRGQESKIVQTT